ncbi:Uncharacterized protein HKD37_20G057260 [Glycine soja]
MTFRKRFMPSRNYFLQVSWVVSESSSISITPSPRKGCCICFKISYSYCFQRPGNEYASKEWQLICIKISMVDYEYLNIVVGGGVSSGNNSISVDPDDTDATTFEPENRTVGIEEFSYDPNSDTFITPNNYEPAYQPPSPNQPSPPSHPPLDSEVPIEKQNCHKRRRSEYGGSSSAVGINNQGNVLENLSVGIGTIAVNFEKISNMMEKREKDRDRDRELEGIIWDVIKEIPNLDDITRFKTAELLNTKAKKDFFLKMSSEERSSWINFKLGNN